MTENGEAKEVRPFRAVMRKQTEEGAEPIDWPQGLVVEMITPFYWIQWEVDVMGADFDAVTNDGERFDHDCYLRLTMEAINQPPLPIDFAVDWDAAEADGTFDIKPRT